MPTSVATTALNTAYREDALGHKGGVKAESSRAKCSGLYPPPTAISIVLHQPLPLGSAAAVTALLGTSNVNKWSAICRDGFPLFSNTPVIPAHAACLPGETTGRNERK